jgi:hypothetical protein
VSDEVEDSVESCDSLSVSLASDDSVVSDDSVLAPVEECSTSAAELDPVDVDASCTTAAEWVLGLGPPFAAAATPPSTSAAAPTPSTTGIVNNRFIVLLGCRHRPRTMVPVAGSCQRLTKLKRPLSPFARSFRL